MLQWQAIMFNFLDQLEIQLSSRLNAGANHPEV